MIRGLSQPAAILAAMTPRSCSPHCMSQSASILLQPQLQMNSLATSETTRARADGAHIQVTATQAATKPVRRTVSLLTRFLSPNGGGAPHPEGTRYPVRGEGLGQRMAILHGKLCDRA